MTTVALFRIFNHPVCAENKAYNDVLTKPQRIPNAVYCCKQLIIEAGTAVHESINRSDGHRAASRQVDA